MYHSIFFTAALFLDSVSVQPGSLPAPITEICARDGITCIQDKGGLILGSSQSLPKYKGTIDEAKARFKTYFGRDTPEAAIVLGDLRQTDVFDTVSEHYVIVLPWLTEADRQAMIRKSIKDQFQQKMPDLDDDALQAAVDASLNRTKNANRTEEENRGVLSHELGHMFFINSFYPTDTERQQETGVGQIERYGGPAPDWLDEMSAILMENEALTNKRHDGMAKLMASGDKEAIWPLAEFLIIEHPAFGQIQRMMKANKEKTQPGKKGSIVMIAKEREAGGRQPSVFYLQSRAFADFLIERSDNKQIFAEIADYDTRGKKFVDWLNEAGASYHLPVALASLEVEFQGWLQDRYKAEN